MTHPRPFRFGVICAGAGIDGGSQFGDLARRSEELGYSSLFVPDHFVDHPLSPTAALAHAAAVTSTLRIGPLVLGNDYRHPVVLARDMATLDLLSDGRLELGIGAGWMTLDYERAGLALDPPSVRIARLEESIAILKGLFAPGPFTFDGRYYQVRDLDGRPKPVQQPVPFCIGGGGPKILAVAAREAAIVGVNANLRSGVGDSSDAVSSLTATATDQKLEWLHAAAGDRFDDLEIQTLVGFTHLTDDPAPIIEGMASHFGVTPEDARLAPVTLVGSIDEMVDLLEARRDRWQMSYVVIGAEALEAFAPVVARLNGK